MTAWLFTSARPTLYGTENEGKTKAPHLSLFSVYMLRTFYKGKQYFRQIKLIKKERQFFSKYKSVY